LSADSREKEAHFSGRYLDNHKTIRTMKKARKKCIFNLMEER